MFAFIGWVIFGLFIGLIARFLMPGSQSMGFVVTILLGVAGSFVGGYLGSLIHGGPIDAAQPAGWIGSLAGAIVLLVIYGMLQKRQA